MYDKEKGIVAFGPDKRTDRVKSGKMVTVKIRDITLEEVLNSEISHGYVNVDVGDPLRQYAYGHMLRKHAGFKLFEWSKNVMIKWNRYNVVATSRGQ